MHRLYSPGYQPAKVRVGEGIHHFAAHAPDTFAFPDTGEEFVFSRREGKMVRVTLRLGRLVLAAGRTSQPVSQRITPKAH